MATETTRRAPPSAEEWVTLAVLMQRRANHAELTGAGARVVRGYCRRRDFCAAKAERMGARPWSAIDAEAERLVA